ncbi:MAG: ferredoxin [Deltaproteobacteria bacterium]
MKAVVDQEKCIGCTLCTQVCPEVFKMEGDKAVAYVNPVPRELEEKCKDAAQQCPVEAITVK